MEFKDRIKILRRGVKMTQAGLAEMVGKTESAIRAWESGKAKPDADTLIKLAEHFNCTADYLLGLNDYRNQEEKSDLISLSSTLNESLSKFSNGKELFEHLVHFIEFTDMENYEIAISNFLLISYNFLQRFLEMQDIRSRFIQTKTFNLSEYIDFLTELSNTSALANRSSHIISTLPASDLLNLAYQYGSESNRDAAQKIYRAYYERFIYEYPEHLK